MDWQLPGGNILNPDILNLYLVEFIVCVSHLYDVPVIER